MKAKLIAFAGVLCFGLGATALRADTAPVDPPIFIGSPSCTLPGGCPVFGNEVNGISGTTVTLLLQGGNSSLNNPVLLIIGVPNDNGTFSAPSISLPGTSSGVLGGPATAWGGTWNTAGTNPVGFAGQLNSIAGKNDAYEVINFADPNGGGADSESFANWSAADSQVLGITATGFGIYVYELTLDPNFAAKSTINITFGSALPTGTFLIAYGCDSTPCGSSGNVYATPFTQSGLVMGAPEPTSLSLLSGGLFGLLFLRRRLTHRA